MKREVEWIKEALAEDPAKSQSGIARALNLDKSSVSRMLHGERRLKFEEALAIARYLEVDPPYGFQEDAADYAPGADAGKAPLADVYRAEPAADGFIRVNRALVVERRPRVGELIGAPYAFGVFVPDAAMAPRFKIGEIAWVNPARPAGPGDDAMLAPADAQTKAIDVLIGEVREASADTIVAFQHASEDDPLTFDRRHWTAWRVLPRY